MLSRNIAKYVKSLQFKKYRKQHQAYLAEGTKIVLEVLKADVSLSHLLATTQFLEQYPQYREGDYQLVEVSAEELRQLGSLQQNQSVIAVVSMPGSQQEPSSATGWLLALDGINDPGNLGTIIRIADWYGISHVLCSPETVDAYNPKVLSASMGSFLRVQLHYGALEEQLPALDLPVYGAVLAGESVYQTAFAERGILLIGSESHGIRQDLLPLLQHRVTIPRKGQAESLNAGVATAILLDNLARSPS